MIQCVNLSKAYAGRTLFEQGTFQIAAGERVGLLGRNGSGKTTLFRLLSGEESRDAGEIQRPRGYRIGYLEQRSDFGAQTIRQVLSAALPEAQAQNWYQAEKILFGLGLEGIDVERAVGELSSGQQMRVKLAKLLVNRPNLLLLDEPTNYLDILAVRWLRDFLHKWPGEMMLITHDRSFMDSVVTHTLGIVRQSFKKRSGGAAKFFELQQEEEDIHEKTRLNQEKKRQEMQQFISKFRAKARQAGLVQSRIKQLEKMQNQDQLIQLKNLNFTFNYEGFSSKNCLQVDSLGLHYPEQEWLFRELNFQVRRGECLGIIGKNGKGKSSLMRVLAGQLQAMEGSFSWHPEVRLAYFGESAVAQMHANNSIEQEIALANEDLPRTQVRNICGSMLFSGDEAQKKIAVLSGGERYRVLLGKILATSCNVLLLDEPSNHLDLESVEALCQALQNFEGSLLLITHNEYLLKHLTHSLLVFREDYLEYLPQTYTEFLEKYGWETTPTRRLQKTVKMGRREYRQKKTELTRRRNEELGPLKRRMEAIEGDIESNELRLVELQQELIDSSTASGPELASLSKEFKAKESALELAYEQLEVVAEEYENLRGQLEEQLQSLEMQWKGEGHEEI